LTLPEAACIGRVNASNEAVAASEGVSS
jgi:hypothetical protein